MADAGARVLETERVEARFVKHLRHKAHLLFDGDILPVRHADAARLLAAVLKREQAQVTKRRNVRCLGKVEREYTAFLLRFV